MITSERPRGPLAHAQIRWCFFLLTQIYVSTFFLLTQHFFFRPSKQRFLARDPRLEVKPYSYSLPYTTFPAVGVKVWYENPGVSVTVRNCWLWTILIKIHLLQGVYPFGLKSFLVWIILRIQKCMAGWLDSENFVSTLCGGFQGWSLNWESGTNMFYRWVDLTPLITPFNTEKNNFL